MGLTSMQHDTNKVSDPGMWGVGKQPAEVAPALPRQSHTTASNRISTAHIRLLG